MGDSTNNVVIQEYHSGLILPIGGVASGGVCYQLDYPIYFIFFLQKRM